MSSQNAKSPQARWWRLYAVLPLCVGVFALEHGVPLSTFGHEVAQAGIVLVTFGLICLWLRANAVALMEADLGHDWGKITITETHPFWPSTAPTEGGNGHRPMFYLPEAGLRNTLDDTFDLEPVIRPAKDFWLN